MISASFLKDYLFRTLILLWVVPSLVSGAIGERDMQRESKIEAELEKIDSSLVQPFREARVAYDNKDLVTAKRDLQLVIQHLPNFDPALRRLGGVEDLEGHHSEALKYCEQALKLKRSPENLSTMANILAFPHSGAGSDSDRERALALLEEARRTDSHGDASTLAMIAQLGFQLNRPNVARNASAELEKRYPDEMASHYFAAVTAAMDEDWIKSDREIRIAQKLGLNSEQTERFLDSGVRTRAMGWRAAWAAGTAVALWLTGIILLYVVGVILSKITLYKAHSADPTTSASPAEIRLRRLYRLVLNFAAIYYYISLPVVLMLVIIVSAAVIFAFLAIGYIPIKLTAILAIGALVTIYTMCKSLFIRSKATDPGRPLARHEAEGLWQLTEDVAHTMNTRPIDEIRITCGTDLAVYEKGSWREKINNRAKRVLILGTAVLNGFKQENFRSVLAHEYGHFSNRDTAGGDIAMRVRNDMIKFYVSMREAGQATRLNVAFHFLRVYDFIFRRISHGATRLQEILADRVAAQTYGPAAFEGGLRHVIQQNIAFDSHASLEIKNAIEAARPIQNLYDSGNPNDPQLNSEFENALNRPTTEDDTHPGPMERFRLIAGIPEPEHRSAEGEVWDLFRDRATIIREMTDLIEEQVSRHRPHVS